MSLNYTPLRDRRCEGPYTCPFPRPEKSKRGDRWTCRHCAAEYRLTRRKPERWWRNWWAPYGYWRLTLAFRLTWRDTHPGHPMYRAGRLP